MRLKESAFVAGGEAPVKAPGLLPGALGVLGFSLTLPATRLADPVFGPVTVGIGRALVAALLAAVVLRARREPLVVRALLPRLAIVAVGVVVGFPLLTAFALQHVNSAHAAVVSGLLPVATAGMAVVRAGERPRTAYWIALGAGLIAVLVFAAVQGAGRPQPADALVLAAVALAGLGYAEGGVLAREYGGRQVISWALILASPVLVPVTVVAIVLQPPRQVTAGSVAGLVYVSVVSMFLAFVAWYRGLARGGVARVGRLQVAQPVLTLAWSALLLGEHVSPAAVVAAGAVLASVVLGRKAGAAGPGPSPAAVRPSVEENAAA